MTDTKREFLYEFNHGLRDLYSNNPLIVSVFENIDNGNLRLIPANIPDADFVNKVGKCIYMIKKIVSDPYKSFKGKQEVVPVSKAQNVDKESVRLTLADSSLWAKKDGKNLPEKAYTLVNDFVFTNYENAFICQFINLLIVRLKKIKSKIINEVSDKSAQEYTEAISNIDMYVHKLTRLSNEKVFVDNNRRTVDMANIFLTDILNSDKRYNFCYKFFCENFKSKKTKTSVTKDFRVLYHNFALVQILYNLYKVGYAFDNITYYVSEPGKIFINPFLLNGEKEIMIEQSKNGVDISVGSKAIHVEFAKSLFKDVSEMAIDCRARVEMLSGGKFSDNFVAYLSSENQLVDNAISIGYKSAKEAVSKLINSL